MPSCVAFPLFNVFMFLVLFFCKSLSSSSSLACFFLQRREGVELNGWGGEEDLGRNEG